MFYWEKCPHIMPGLLDRAGKPLARTRMRRKDVSARELTEDDPPLHTLASRQAAASDGHEASNGHNGACPSSGGEKS